MKPENIEVKGTVIRLGQFLKLANLVSSGGEAKMKIQSGEITVNGQVEYKRGLQLQNGDVIEGDESVYMVNYLEDI